MIDEEMPISSQMAETSNTLVRWVRLKVMIKQKQVTAKMTSNRCTTNEIAPSPVTEMTFSGGQRKYFDPMTDVLSFFLDPLYH